MRLLFVRKNAILGRNRRAAPGRVHQEWAGARESIVLRCFWHQVNLFVTAVFGAARIVLDAIV